MAEKKITLEKMQMAERLRCVRERMGFTQEGFANKLNISLSAYKKIESAENSVSVNVLKKLYDLQVSSDYVLFGSHTDVDDAWTTVQNCSEKDKMFLYIMLLLHFSEKDGQKISADEILGLIKKILDEKGIR